MSPLVFVSRLLHGGLGGDQSLELVFTTVHKRKKEAAVPKNTDPTKFVATNSWQDTGKDQSVPAGLQIKFDMQTGRRQAKLLAPRAEDASTSSDEEGSRTTTTLLLHPIGLGYDAAVAEASQRRRELFDFLGGRRGSVTISISSVVLPRLLAALCLLAAVVILDPAGSIKVVVCVGETMKGVVQGRPRPAKPKPPPAYKWTEEAKAAYDAATEAYPKGTEDRWDMIAERVGVLSVEFTTVELCIARDKIVRAAENREAEVEAARVRDLQVAAAAVVHAEEEQAERERRATAAQAKKEAKGAAKAKAQADLAAAQATTTNCGKDEASWSAKEQKQLERGMKLYPASDLRRWDRIANFVASKSEKECVARYKSIVI